MDLGGPGGHGEHGEIALNIPVPPVVIAS